MDARIIASHLPNFAAPIAEIAGFVFDQSSDEPARCSADRGAGPHRRRPSGGRADQRANAGADAGADDNIAVARRRRRTAGQQKCRERDC